MLSFLSDVADSPDVLVPPDTTDSPLRYIANVVTKSLGSSPLRKRRKCDEKQLKKLRNRLDYVNRKESSRPDDIKQLKSEIKEVRSSLHLAMNSLYANPHSRSLFNMKYDTIITQRDSELKMKDNEITAANKATDGAIGKLSDQRHRFGEFREKQTQEVRRLTTEAKRLHAANQRKKKLIDELKQSLSEAYNAKRASTKEYVQLEEQLKVAEESKTKKVADIQASLEDLKEQHADAVEEIEESHVLALEEQQRKLKTVANMQLGKQKIMIGKEHKTAIKSEQRELRKTAKAATKEAMLEATKEVSTLRKETDTLKKKLTKVTSEKSRAATSWEKYKTKLLTEKKRLQSKLSEKIGVIHDLERRSLQAEKERDEALRLSRASSVRSSQLKEVLDRTQIGRKAN